MAEPIQCESRDSLLHEERRDLNLRQICPFAKIVDKPWCTKQIQRTDLLIPCKIITVCPSLFFRMTVCTSLMTTKREREREREREEDTGWQTDVNVPTDAGNQHNWTLAIALILSTLSFSLNPWLINGVNGMQTWNAAKVGEQVVHLNPDTCSLLLWPQHNVKF